jgi:hypothetical protein
VCLLCICACSVCHVNVECNITCSLVIFLCFILLFTKNIDLKLHPNPNPSYLISYISHFPKGGLPVIDASSSGVPYRGMRRFPEEESEHEGIYIFVITVRT